VGLTAYATLADVLEPLQDVRAAGEIIKEDWAVEQSAQKTEVQPGGLRCTFVLS
jgi:hypothetical protein